MDLVAQARPDERPLTSPPEAFPETAAESEGQKYLAFLSYSHRDTAWAKWLHRALEGYRIDKDVVGRETAAGPVPKALRPIFRDREDFAAGHSLTDQTLASLVSSKFLIVICSPSSAKSKYVEEEIRRFKALGRGGRIIPIIVGGEPDGGQNECFPAALRFKIGPDGSITAQREEPIAADARPHRDGKELAKRKIIAGLLGVPLDEIIHRAERAQRRRKRILAGTITAGLLLIIGAIVGWDRAISVSSRLVSSENLTLGYDAADLCEQATNYALSNHAPEEKRIELSYECVATLSEIIDGSSPQATIPTRFMSIFADQIDILDGYNKKGKLTPEQVKVLNKGKDLVARFGDG
jgi:hypothetical protein